MNTGIFSAAALISAFLAINFRQRHNAKMYAAFKPFTTLIILLIAISTCLKYKNNYSSNIIPALVFCLIGDVLLINKKYFILGLSSFLIAHICFTIAFSSIYGFCWKVLPLLLLLLIMGLFINYLKRDLHRYFLPVIFYSIAILFMNWQATGLIYMERSIPAYGVAVASLLFLFSDSVIAYTRYKKAFKSAEILVLSSYWTAIYIFAIAGMFFN